jgi:putative chitinase
MIDWQSAQARLGVKQDGRFGPVSFAALLVKVAGHAVPLAHDLAMALVANATAYGVDENADRLSCFLGQCCHESAGFLKMQEDGGPAYFTRLYEDRADLGNTQPGDGAHFHGRGIIQITGRANYRRLGREIGLDLVVNPDLAAQPTTAVLLALEYWKDRGLNALADHDDVQTITRRVNGGLAGLAQRMAYTNTARSVLA